MNDMFNSYFPNYAGFSNGAGTIEDVKTGQIIAMIGSRDFNYPGMGKIMQQPLSSNLVHRSSPSYMLSYLRIRAKMH